MPPFIRFLTVLALLLLLALPASAQGFGQATPLKQWGAVAAELGLLGQGAMVGYGQQALFGDNADARFSVAYASRDYDLAWGAEFAVTALSYTYRPNTAEPQLYLIAYGGVGPRLQVQGGVYDFSAPEGAATAVSLNVGALGGLEARLQRFGIFLELDLSLPAVGVVGPRFAFFPLAELTLPKLALGTNVYF